MMTTFASTTMRQVRFRMGKALLLVALVHVYIVLLIFFFHLERKQEIPHPPTPMPYCYSYIRSQEQAFTILKDEIKEFKKQKEMKIPKIIHVIYRDRDIPKEYTKLVKSWVKHNPDYEFYFWDDIRGPQFVKKYYPEFFPMYEAYCNDLLRSDALRYFVLHKYGGIYVDMDYECYKPINGLLNGSRCHVVQENWAQAKVLYQKDMMVQNSWMAMTPGHPFINFVINSLPSSAQYSFIWGCSMYRVLNATGPLLLDRCRRIYSEVCVTPDCGVNILPSNIMMPEYVVDNSRTKFQHYDQFCRKDLLKHLDDGGRKACDKFTKEINNLPKIGPEIYASHKFLHLGNDGHKFKSRCYTDIKKLIPKIVLLQF